MNGELKNVQNWIRTDSESEDDDDDEDDEEVQEETGVETYDTSEHDRRYALIRNNLEEDTKQINTG